MKSIQFTTVVLLLCFASCSKTRTDLDEMKLLGPVKSVWEKQYAAYGDDNEKAQKGKLSQSIKFVFNPTGNLTEVVWFDADNDTLQKVLTFYDANRRVNAKKMYTSSGSLDMQASFQYDEKGRNTLTEYNDGEGNFLQKEIVEYNDENHIETTFLYNDKTQLIKKIVVQKDVNELPKETKIYNEERELVNFRKDEYNEQKQLSHFWVFAADEETIVLDAKLNYDKGGNLISRDVVGEDGEHYLPETYKYEFDQHRNWIRSAIYEGDEINQLKEREIEYY